jgi:hypothetical protein
MKSSHILILATAVSLIILSSEAQAVGIAPAILQIENGQGFTKTYNYYVRGGSRGGEITIKVSCRNDVGLEQYIKPEFESLYFNPGELKYFKVYVDIPSNFSIPGRHLCTVDASEVPSPGTSTMSAFSSISSQIYIQIPYPEKFIEATLSAPNVNVSMPVPFTISVKSLGLEDVLTSGIIRVTDSEGKNMGTLYTEQILVKSLERGVIGAEWDSTGNPPGIYRAEATVEYGGDSPAIADTIFRLGDIYIDIKNITVPEEINPDKVVKFVIISESFWNMRIEDVYIELEVSRDSAMTRSSRSESFDMDPWEEKSVTVYLDTSGMEEGDYDAVFTAHYSGKYTEESIKVEIKEPLNMLLLAIVIAIIIAAAAILAILIRKRRKRRGEIRL